MKKSVLSIMLFSAAAMSAESSNVIYKDSCQLVMEENQLDRDRGLEKMLKKKGYKLVKYNVSEITQDNRDGDLARRAIPDNAMILNTQMRSSRQFSFSNGVEKTQRYKYTIIQIQGRPNPEKFRFLNFDDTRIGYVGYEKVVATTAMTFKNDVLTWGDGDIESDLGTILDGYEKRASALLRNLPNCDDGQGGLDHGDVDNDRPVVDDGVDPGDRDLGQDRPTIEQPEEREEPEIEEPAIEEPSNQDEGDLDLDIRPIDEGQVEDNFGADADAGVQ